MLKLEASLPGGVVYSGATEDHFHTRSNFVEGVDTVGFFIGCSTNYEDDDTLGSVKYNRVMEQHVYITLCNTYYTQCNCSVEYYSHEI